MIETGLVLMDAGMFCAGMHIGSSIYYHYKGTYVLLCRNVVLTENLIRRIHTLSKATNGVFIEEAHYEEVWNESLRQYSYQSNAYERSYQKIRRAYDQVLAKTVCFLGNLSPKSGFPLHEANEIAESISNDIIHMDQSLMLRCINMINAADSYLYTHCVNVATLNGLIGQWMKLSEIEIKQLIKVGLLHDLGKLKVPSKILNKPGKLTEEEFAVIKRHPTYSQEMLYQAGEQNENVLYSVRQHHEKPNGSGYPDGLHQDQILLCARVTAVSDVYDAMVSNRCYKSAKTPFEVLAQFKDHRFSDLDLSIVNLFIENATFLFIGMHVKLSNGDCGEVVFIPPNDCANPVVKVGNRVFPTSVRCQCVATGRNYVTYSHHLRGGGFSFE